jgi:S1-C subfamily serine protease
MAAMLGRGHLAASLDRQGRQGRLSELARLAVVSALTLLVATAFWLSPLAHSLTTGTWQPTAIPSQPLAASEEATVRACREASAGVISITSAWHSDGAEVDSHGAGFFLDAEGHAVTADHVLTGGQSIEVTLADGTRLRGEVVGRDPSHDIAVIRVRASGEQIRPLRLGDSDSVQVGQTAIAIGHPLGYQRSVSVGTISALGRSVGAPDGKSIREIIQVDASVNDGSSGGPLLDSRGEVVGVVVASTAPTGRYGFAIPINLARRIAADLIASGRVPYAWLGASGVALTPRVAQALGLSSERGVIVSRVAPGGPADRAGLRAGTWVRKVEVAGLGILLVPEGGDVITRVDEHPVTAGYDLGEYLGAAKRAGDVVRLEVLRDGVSLSLDVRLSEPPTNPPAYLLDRPEDAQASYDW